MRSLWINLIWLGRVSLLLAAGTVPLHGGQSVTLAWDPNPEPDIAGYKFYYGTSSRDYSTVIPLGKVTTNTVAGLIPEVTYYFAVTAFNTAGLESDFSAEVSYTVPALPLTISPIADQTITQGTATGVINFTVSDGYTSGDTLVVTASSSNPLLAPASSLLLGGSGGNRMLRITPPANQSGQATITVTVSNDRGRSSSTSFVLTVTPLNTAPTISAIADQSIYEDTAIPALPFSIGDAETPPGGLFLAAQSSNPALVPDNQLGLSGSGSNRVLTITPALNHFGTATITLRVTDGALVTTRSFLLTVHPVNDAPLLSSIPSQTIDQDTATAPLPFTVMDVEMPTGQLTVWASSSNTELVPSGGLLLVGSGTNRTLTIQPAPAQSGTATITVSASDGSATVTSAFVLTVRAVAAPLEISDVRVEAVISSSAAIAWTTSVPANSQVEYGLTTSFGAFSELDTEFTTTHHVNLENLQPATTYYFRVLSRDAFGNAAVSAAAAFTTAAAPSPVKFYLPVAATEAGITAPMALVADPLDPQRPYLLSPVGNQGSATFTFFVPETDTYTVWCRLQVPGSGRDLFRVSMNGDRDIFDAPTGSGWQWTPLSGRRGWGAGSSVPRKFLLAPGWHTLRFEVRQAHVGLSRLIVTSDLNFTPDDGVSIASAGTALTLSEPVMEMTLEPGYSLLADPLLDGANTVAEVLPSVPEGTALAKYDSSTGAYDRNQFRDGRWSNPNATLAPGEGAFIYNPAGHPVKLIFAGQMRFGAVPRPVATGLTLISAAIPRTGRFSELFDWPLQEGDTVHRYVKTEGGFVTHRFAGGQWDREPVIRIGESFFFGRSEP